MANPEDRVLAIEQGLMAVLGLARLDGRRALMDRKDVEIPLSALPGSTLLFSFISDDDATTGGGTNNGWQWFLRLYTDYTKPDLAQRQMKRLIPEVLRVLRNNRDLMGSCDNSEVTDGGPPTPTPSRGLLTKTLIVTAFTEEFDEE